MISCISTHPEPRRPGRWAPLASLAGLLLLGVSIPTAADARPSPAKDAGVPSLQLPARVMAVGLRGVQGVRQVGMFHSGGPIVGNPDFLMKTRKGRVLDPQRVLVACESRFGATAADPAQRPGAVLSLDLSGPEPLRIPADFARRGGQQEALDGRVRLYTAQTPDFVNGRHNPEARTATQPAVAGPRYISINNAFGRPWFANSPFGHAGVGSVSVVDPDGAPLDNPPSERAGGVFFGTLTPRTHVPVGRVNTAFTRLINYRDAKPLTAGGLVRGAAGTAFLGASPDGSGFAVFAVAMADGSVVQAHVQDGIDGLAPAGTVAPAEAAADQGVIGMAFKWTPDRVLYIADGQRNRLAMLTLKDDGRHFKLGETRYLTDLAYRMPVDVAAAVPEIANPRFASHTTMAGGSDLYVLNRGDGSVLRVDQQGRVLARAQIRLPGGRALGGGVARALAVSADAQKLWVTVQGELPGHAGHEGGLLELPAFDLTGTFEGRQQQLERSPELVASHTGRQAFMREMTPAEGLGPLFNARSCLACHSDPGVGGTSAREEHFALRVARLHPVTGRLETLEGMNSPVARRRSLREMGHADAPEPVPPRLANVTSIRMPMSLYDVGGMDAVPDAAILAHAVSKGDGIKGRPNWVVNANGEPKVGRFGWKADAAGLEQMVANAYANELGITSPLAPGNGRLDDDGRLARQVTAFLRSLKKPDLKP